MSEEFFRFYEDRLLNAMREELARREYEKALQDSGLYGVPEWRK